MGRLGGYEGPKHGGGNEDYISVSRCGDEVVGSARMPEYPRETKYSREVARRIIDGRTPIRSVARILGWPERESKPK